MERPARPCKNTLTCSELIPGDAPVNKEFHSDPCGREYRRLMADPAVRARYLSPGFWGQVFAIRRLAPGTALKGGRNRRVASEVVA